MILLNDFKKQYVQLKEEIDSAVSRVLESGWYILGKEVELFEADFAEYIGMPYCVGVASGTEAIALSLMALGIKQGDEVITPCFTAFPTITGIMQAGAVPVLLDVNPQDGLIDVTNIQKKITGKTKAIVPVHLYGQSCDMEPLLKHSQFLWSQGCGRLCPVGWRHLSWQANRIIWNLLGLFLLPHQKPGCSW